VITDQQRVEFLNKLVAAVRGKNGLVLPEWENNFVASFIRFASARFFTDGRRVATDRIWMRYGPEINWPHPLDYVTERPAIADADPTGCEYLVRDEGGPQRRCNEPATCCEPGRLRYCAMHGDAVVKAMKFAGKTIRLVNL